MKLIKFKDSDFFVQDETTTCSECHKNKADYVIEAGGGKTDPAVFICKNCLSEFLKQSSDLLVSDSD